MKMATSHSRDLSDTIQCAIRHVRFCDNVMAAAGYANNGTIMHAKDLMSRADHHPCITAEWTTGIRKYVGGD